MISCTVELNINKCTRSTNIAAKDATEDFEDIGHSETAKDMLKSFYVGEFAVSTIPAKQKATTTKHSPETDQPSRSSGFLVKLLQFLLPLLMLGLAFAMQKFKKQD